MITIFSKYNTPRLQYVLDFILREKGCDYNIINDEDEWNSVDGIKLNYSTLPLECDYAIEPSGLLNETEIDELLKLELEDDVFLIRGTEDPLSLIFYLISRYEEYQEHQKDEHGRFTAKNSQQYHLDILHKPLADIAVKELWRKLGLDYNEVKDRFECVPSFDIDIAWAYKNRPLWRTFGAFIKGKILERIGVLLGFKKDPYDTYSEIVNISAQVDRIICFVPVSDWASFDKNISWTNTNYQSLIRGLNASGGMGLHPGYHSHLNVEKLEEEKDRLEQIVGHKMEKNRFHFLRYEIPKSYNNLLKAGFKKDYSMGYADEVGFRASTSFPYYFFDLNTNKKCDLLVFPFIYMDSALKDQLQLSPDQSLEKIKSLIDEVKSVGGLFMCIWHNHSINNKGEWKNWLEVLRKTVEWTR